MEKDDRRYAVWIESITAHLERFRTDMLRLGVGPKQVEMVVREAPCCFQGGLSLEAADALKNRLRECGARVIVKVEPPPARVASGTNPPREAQPAPTAALDGLFGGPALELDLPGEPVAPLRDPEMVDLDQPPPQGGLELDERPRRFTPGSIALPLSAGAEVDPAVADQRAPLQIAPIDLAEPLNRPVRAGAQTLAPEPPPPDPRWGATAEAPARPPAVWEPPDLTAARRVGYGVLALLALVMAHCAARYHVDSKLHDFSATCDDQLEQQLLAISREQGRPASAADLKQASERVASAAGVELEILGVTEIRVVGATDMTGCRRGRPERNPHLPTELLYELNLRNIACEAPAWIVGVRAKVKARTLWASHTRYVEQFAFADSYVGLDGRRSSDWVEGEMLIELLQQMPQPPPMPFE